MQIQISRDTFTPNETLGVAILGNFAFDTIERPDLNDQAGVSCIPLGTYDLVPHVSARLHEDDGVTPLQTWALVNPSLGVFHYAADGASYNGTYPVRSTILIHPDNLASTLEGCIGPGDSRTKVGEFWMVTNSRATFKKIRDILGGPGTTGHTIAISKAE